MSDTLPVVEIFHSVQGEGTRVGEPATFVRLAGCNLRCTWCDTPYSWSAEGMRDALRLTAEQIASQVSERSVVLTGGEPLLHLRKLPQLLQRLRTSGMRHVTVETNATVEPTGVWDSVDLWSLSPKLPASGERYDEAVVQAFLSRVPERCQLKFVVADIDEDYEAMWQLVEQCNVPPAVPLVIQPDGLRDDYGEALRELSEHLLADTAASDGIPRRSRVRVIPQTHRVAWGARARGV